MIWLEQLPNFSPKDCGIDEKLYFCRTNIKKQIAMCTLSVKMDDKVMSQVKPLFDDDTSMNHWIETVLLNAMLEFAAQHEDWKKRARENAELLARLKELENDPDGLLKLGGILGKPKKGFSWEELREEATFEKYGI